MTASKNSSTVATRYSHALLELASESKKIDKVLADIGDLKAMIAASADLASVIASPLISKGDQENAMMVLAKKAKFQELTTNFIGVIVQNGRLNVLSEIIQAFEFAYAQTQGQVNASVKTAQKLSAKQEKELQKSLSAMAGKDVVLDVQVDPTILGGMVVTLGSYMIDNSVSRKLVRLKNAMVAGAQGHANENNPSNENLSEVS